MRVRLRNKCDHDAICADFLFVSDSEERGFESLWAGQKEKSHDSVAFFLQYSSLIIHLLPRLLIMHACFADEADISLENRRQKSIIAV